MKCKRIFKVAGALALTVALLVSSAVVSFAAEYKTTTKYLNQNTIEVTSVASDLSTRQQLPDPMMLFSNIRQILTM